MMATIVKQHDKRVGITYAYESASYWDKEKQQSRSKRRLIGIVDRVTGEIVPTTRKKRATNKVSDNVPPDKSIDESWLRAERKFYGATYLLDCIGKQTGLVNDLSVCFPDCYKQVLSIAYYLILEDRNPLCRFPKWSRTHVHPHGDIIASQRSSELFAGITETQRMHFFRLQGKRRVEKEYWAYDTTSITSYSDLIVGVRRGKNKDHDPLPQINLALLQGGESDLPFYYRRLPGNISDVSTVQQVLSDMEFLGYTKIKLTMDRGFYSAKNINGLYNERLKFIMGAKLSPKYIRCELDKIREDLRSWENYLSDAGIHGMRVPFQWVYKRYRPNKKDLVDESRRMYLYFYFNPTKAIDEELDFAKLIHGLHHELTEGKRETKNQALYSKYFDVKTTPVRGRKVIAKQKALDEARKDFGYFVLIGNEPLSPERVLELYRNKDVVEKAFDNIKDRLDCRRLNVSSDLTFDGKLFVMFVALIFIAFLHKAMIDAHLYIKHTMHELLDELEMIERFERQGHRPQFGEVTVKQSDIYKALGFTPPKSSL